MAGTMTPEQLKWASTFTGLDAATKARVEQMDADYHAAVDAGDWKKAATVVNGYAAADLQKHLKVLNKDQLGKLYQGALDGGIGPDSAAAKAAQAAMAQPAAGKPGGADTAEADRIKKLGTDLAAAVKAQDWSKAAQLLNAYSEAEINKKIAALKISAGQLQLIHDAAVKNPGVGPNSNIAKLTDNLLIGGKFDSGNAANNDMKSSLIEAAHNVQNRAKINAVAYGQAVADACQDFKAYAKPKLEAKKNEITAGDLAQALVSIAVPKVGELIGNLVKNEIGKKVVSKVADVAKDKMGKAVNSKDSDVAALEKVVDDLADGARNAASGIVDAVVSVIQKPCDDVIKAANAMTGDTEINAAGQDFIGPFYKATAEAIDATLEGYGIPSSATSKTNRVRIYTALVKGFEKQLYSSGYTAQDKAVRTQGQLDAEAEGMADNAAQKARTDKEAELAPH